MHKSFKALYMSAQRNYGNLEGLVIIEWRVGLVFKVLVMRMYVEA